MARPPVNGVDGGVRHSRANLKIRVSCCWPSACGGLQVLLGFFATKRLEHGFLKFTSWVPETPGSGSEMLVSQLGGVGIID